MANVFLSYDREDEARARSIAAFLEKSGHSVWWDRQIKGGGEFGAEIEAALNAADKVVVLWSERAVKSAWVRDEAAVGRDTGRLVPATLDGTPPPLGFRQFQTIELSGSKRLQTAAQLKGLAEAIGSPSRKDLLTAETVPDTPPNRKSLVLIGGIAAVFLLSIAAIVLWRSGTQAAQPRFAISSADASEQSRQAAHELALKLPTLPATVTNYELVDASQSPSTNADLVLTTGVTNEEGKERQEVAIRMKDSLLWSLSVEQPTVAASDLSQQVAVQVQRALSCSGDALSYRRERFDENILKSYLSACTNFDSAFGANVDMSDQIKVFEQVIAKAPHFVPAWAMLLTTEADDLANADDRNAVIERMRDQVAEADKLGLDFGELYVAKAVLRSPIDFWGIFQTLDEGIKRHPDNAILYRARGIYLMYVGRMNDAVTDSARAVDLNALSPGSQQSLASAYAYAGNPSAGFAQLKRAEQLWPGARTIVYARYRLNLRYGDPKEALALLNSWMFGGPLQSEQAAFLQARLDPTPSNIQRAIAEDRKIYLQYPDFIGQIVQTLAQFGRKDEVLDILMNYKGGEQSGLAAEVLFRPALRDVWRDPRSMAAAAHLGLLRYWKRSGNWPDFCSDPSLPYNCRQESAKYPI